MLNVLCLGEVLVDMLGQLQTTPDGTEQKVFRPFAGGAPANVAVAVARLGGRSQLISKVGEDTFGRFLTDTLERYQVDTRYVTTATGKTALAFVDLDARGERTFEFYVDNAAHKDLQEKDIEPVAVDGHSVVHLCSGSFSTELLTSSAELLIERTRANHGLLCMDINWRPGFWRNPAHGPGIIGRAAGRMDIIKASAEELDELYGDQADTMIEQWIKQGVQLILITDGANPVQCITPTHRISHPVPAPQVVDTTAAGDAFIGGLLYYLAATLSEAGELSRLTDSAENLHALLSFASQCGAVAVSRFGAFDALPTSQDVALP